MTEFTPLASLAGGTLIGLASILLMAYEGRIAGISGIAGRLLPPYRDDAFTSRLGFVLGLVAAPLVLCSSRTVLSCRPSLPILSSWRRPA